MPLGGGLGVELRYHHFLGEMGTMRGVVVPSLGWTF
jgi:hypothetical protein